MKEYKCTCTIGDLDFEMKTTQGYLTGNAYDQFSNYLELKGFDIDYTTDLHFKAIDEHDAK